MLRTIAVALVTFIGLSTFAHESVHAQSRTLLKNDFGIEFLGKAVIYSFSYQRMVTPQVGLEVGLSALGGSGAAVAFIPVGARYYVISKNHSPFITAGMTPVFGTIDTGPDNLSGWTKYGYVGPGFEFRSQGGFLFRATAYMLFSGGGYFFWPGLNVGYAF
jgi:hypothetical protein